MTPRSHEAIQLLLAWSEGDKQALDRLVPLVYDELRRLAQSYLRKERADQTLQTTALIHEAYVRLIDANRVKWPQLSALLRRCGPGDEAGAGGCGARAWLSETGRGSAADFARRGDDDR